MYQHYGHNVTITNNIFALGTGGVGEVWQHGNSGNAGPEGVSDLNFETNIVYVDARVGPALFGGSWLGNSSFKSNLYWNASATDSAKSLADAQQFPSWKQGTQHGAPGSGEGACNRTFSQWQQSGEDAGSVIADPKSSPATAPHHGAPRIFRSVGALLRASLVRETLCCAMFYLPKTEHLPRQAWDKHRKL
jgi:hypothetical protein